jgi:nitrite reductase/ring-hydroxylating ferredoxin subunit
MMRAKAEQEPRRKLVAKVGELAHGASKKFKIRRGEFDTEALLVNYQGNLFAYLNRCPHVGISLDWVDNQFFTVDRRCAPITARCSSRRRENVCGGPASAPRCRDLSWRSTTKKFSRGFQLRIPKTERRSSDRHDQGVMHERLPLLRRHRRQG